MDSILIWGPRFSNHMSGRKIYQLPVHVNGFLNLYQSDLNQISTDRFVHSLKISDFKLGFGEDQATLGTVSGMADSDSDDVLLVTPKADFSPPVSWIKGRPSCVRVMYGIMVLICMYPLDLKYISLSPDRGFQFGSVPGRATCSEVIHCCFSTFGASEGCSQSVSRGTNA